MAGRYTMPGPWTVESRDSIESYSEGEHVGTVTVETGPLVDSRGGYRYDRGAYRVSITGPAGRPRGKTFKGETAWCQADNLRRDAIHWLQRYDPPIQPW